MKTIILPPTSQYIRLPGENGKTRGPRDGCSGDGATGDGGSVEQKPPIVGQRRRNVISSIRDIFTSGFPGWRREHCYFFRLWKMVLGLGFLENEMKLLSTVTF